MPLTDKERALCDRGACAFHVNSGKRWTVAERLNGGYLIVRDSGGFEKRVSVEYWLSGAFADPDSAESGAIE